MLVRSTLIFSGLNLLIQYIQKKATCIYVHGRANIIFGSVTAPGMTGDDNIVMGEFASRKCGMSGDHNIVMGACAGCMMTSALNNIVLGIGAARGGVFTGNDNVVLGAQAASNFCGAACNIILGRDAAQNITTGQRNIIIGKNVDPPAADSDDTLAIGCNTSRWIAGDSSFNVTLAGIATAHSDGTLLSKQVRVSGLSTFMNDATFGTETTLMGARITATKHATGFTTALAAHNNTGQGSKIISSRALVLSADYDNNSGTTQSIIAFETDGTEKVRITHEGKVGIASVIGSPRSELHVEGSIHATRFFQDPTALDSSESFPADGGAAVNGGVYGPYTINTGVTLTIGDGSTFTVV